jgi:hypothetical protein
MITNLVLHPGNDNSVILEGVVDIYGAYINDPPSALFTLYNSDGVTEVPGQVWPISPDFQVGSNGDYRLHIADTVEIVDGGEYQGNLIMDDGPGRRMNAWLKCFGRKRVL